MNLRIGSHISDQNGRLSAFAWIMVVMCAVLVSVVQLGTMVSLLAGRVQQHSRTFMHTNTRRRGWRDLVRSLAAV